jgi:hypothetical protein
MDIIRMISAVLLCLTLAGLAFAVWVRRGGLSLRGRPTRKLRVCESVALDPRTNAHVLAWDDRRWLVVSASGALHAHELPADAQEPVNERG